METDTATVITPSVSTAVTYAIMPASTRDGAGLAANGLYGYWISDPLVLPGTPVTGSIVRWQATVPGGTTLLVQTSINNGASWDLATNNQPIPRLRERDVTTQFVLARIVFTRPTVGSTSPKVSYFEMDVSTDASVDELVPVGHGMIDKVTVTTSVGAFGSGSSSGAPNSSGVISKGGGQSGGGTAIKVHVTDLSRAIKRNVWQQPFTVAGGTNYGTAAQQMVVNRLPDQTVFAISSTTRTTGGPLIFGLQQGGDPWQDIMELAQAIGFEAFFDAKGVFVFRPVPDPRIGDPVWTFGDPSNPQIVEASRELSDEQTFNDIVVIGQATASANAVSAEAFDNNPASPTYILGPYNRVTQRLTFTNIFAQDQAQAAANATLYNSLGAADTVTITVVPMPALEPGDIVKIVSSNINVNGTYMVNSMTISLSPGDPMQLVCFKQSTT